MTRASRHVLVLQGAPGRETLLDQAEGRSVAKLFLETALRPLNCSVILSLMLMLGVVLIPADGPQHMVVECVGR